MDPNRLSNIHMVMLLPRVVLLQPLEVGPTEWSLGHWVCALKGCDLFFVLFSLSGQEVSSFYSTYHMLPRGHAALPQAQSKSISYELKPLRL